MSEEPFILTPEEPSPVSVEPAPPIGTLDLRLADCMDVMREFPDGHFDLAIVDVPYGIGESGEKSITRGTKPDAIWAGRKPRRYHTFNDDEAPETAYFSELKRISKNQIIWGANHFLDRLPTPHSTPCWIIWDKQNGDSDFADGELAWTSLQGSLRIFRHIWAGFRKGEPEDRIHPTQKPVALYKWILANYAKPGMRIIDTHMGSGSIAIACHYAGMHLTACEIDPDYYKAACERIKRETSQTTLNL